MTSLKTLLVAALLSTVTVASFAAQAPRAERHAVVKHHAHRHHHGHHHKARHHHPVR